MNSTNTVVANAMAAKNAAPKGLTPTTKLRLKEDFSDEYGSYHKGDVFPMYAMGGINPRFGTMMVPGRGVTLQIPWEKLEVVNAVARNADRYEEKSFGNGDVKASLKDYGRGAGYEISVYTNGITSPSSWDDNGKKCVAEARSVLSAIERKASALKQAIAWMEQNAKAW